MAEKREAVRVWVLGGFRVSIGTRTIEDAGWRLRKVASLVKLLALAPGHRLHREQVMEILWPELGRGVASNNLRQVLYAARRTFTPTKGSRYLASDHESLVLCPEDDLWVDAEAFESAANTARNTQQPAAYRAALDLYAGDLLPEDRYEAWAEDRRQGLRQHYLALLVGLAKLHEERDEHGQAIEALSKATAEEPTLEEAHVGLLRLHALSGRPEEALARYERLSDILFKRLGTGPAETTRALRDEIASGRFPQTAPTDTMQEESSETFEHNLPTQRTSFVGREQEVVEVKRALAMTRLLTLTGAGGSGKTRLALKVASDLTGVYPDGVWLVELAPLSEGDLIAQAVAGTLGVQERPGEPTVDTIAGALKAKEMLLILDNCEHLVEAAAQLVDLLLASCPRLRVLATSREPLNVSGEVIRVVPPLSLPGAADGTYSAEDLMRHEAVRLFVDRALLRLPDFALTQENAGSVARICRKLDGIPLAIELATARMGALAVEQVAHRLEGSLDVLKGASRTAEARQKTLRASLDWSHDLLSEEERALFRRSSVFAGGWTLETAEVVCSGDGIEREDVLDLLGGLVDKSLMVARASGGGTARYRMLEPVRQYALQKLEESGEAKEVRGQHAGYFLALVEKADTEFWGQDEAIWSERLEAEQDNLRAALSWTLEHGEAETMLHLAGALSWFWESRSHVSEGARWLEEALATGGAATTKARAGVLFGLGQILKRSDIERAQTCLEEALALYEEISDLERVAESMSLLGWVVGYRGDRERAAAYYEKGLTAARESEDRRLIGSLLNLLAYHASESGDLERAQEQWEEALVLHREQGGPVGTSGILMNMGYIELTRGNHERAATLLEESLILSQEAGDKHHVAGCLMCLGIAATMRDEPERARALLKESLTMDMELGSKIDIAEDLEGLAEAAGALDQHLRAARIWGAAGVLREKIRVPWRPTERMLHEPQLIAARSRMDEASWKAAFAEGRTMTFEEAVEYALNVEESDPPASTMSPASPSDEPVGSLSHREREVATLVAQGLTNRQISTELSISERTAGNHVAKILRKLGLRSRAEITARIGIVTDAKKNMGGTTTDMMGSDG